MEQGEGRHGPKVFGRHHAVGSSPLRGNAEGVLFSPTGPGGRPRGSYQWLTKTPRRPAPSFTPTGGTWNNRVLKFKLPKVGRRKSSHPRPRLATGRKARGRAAPKPPTLALRGRGRKRAPTPPPNRARKRLS